VASLGSWDIDKVPNEWFDITALTDKSGWVDRDVVPFPSGPTPPPPVPPTPGPYTPPGMSGGGSITSGPSCLPEAQKAVAAVASGVVHVVGGRVSLTTPDGTTFVYGPMSRIVADDGEKVTLGEVIGFRPLGAPTPIIVEVIQPGPTATAGVAVSTNRGQPAPVVPAAAKPAPGPTVPTTPAASPAKAAQAKPPSLAKAAATVLVGGAAWAWWRRSSPRKPAWKKMKPRYPDYRKNRKR
jgi:hypothetical protein